MKYFTWIFLVFSFTTIAQNKFVNSFHLDLTTNQIDGDGYAGYKHVGFQFGLGTQYKFDKHRIGFEINYAQRGSRLRSNPRKGIFDDQKIYTNYIDVPVLYIFPKWGIHFEIGPSFSYLLSSYEAFNGIELNNGNMYNGFEVGALISANFKIYDQLYFKFRINNSITGIKKITGASTGYFWEEGSFHRGLGINLTYYFSKLMIGDTGEIDIP